jgi:hypothetical protein
MKLASFMLLLLLPAFLCAQAPPVVQQNEGADRSLGEVARENKQRTTTKSKVTVTEESLSGSSGPIPDLVFEGQDNTDQIIAAIQTFRLSHSRQETESIVHGWYESHDEMLDRAIRENKHIRERKLAERYAPPESLDNPPQDYRQFREQQRAQAHNELSDRLTLQNNDLRMARLQGSLAQVRGSLQRMGLKWDWLKIRCGNGNCSY